jgi:hypothetical protein
MKAYAGILVAVLSVGLVAQQTQAPRSLRIRIIAGEDAVNIIQQ